MNKIEIRNLRLRTYLEYELNKEDGGNIFEEDLEKITQITISTKIFSGEKQEDDLNDLIYFKNLKNCTIKNIIITDSNVEKINQLNKLETLHFDNCSFENLKSKVQLDLDKLILTFCQNVSINQFDIYDYVTSILIESGKGISLKGIENFYNLEKLYLQSMKITDLTEICKLEKLKNLNLNGSIVKDKKSLEKLKTKLDLEYKKDNFKI